MKAWLSEIYGPAEVLSLQDIPDPLPGDDELLIDLKSVSLNAYDWHNMRGDPRLIRLSGGLFRPKQTILGSDASGIVTKVGRNVDNFRPGDRVFGEFHYGGFGEKLCVSTDLMIHMPAGLSFEDASCLPMAGVTALQGLRDRGRIKSGQKVLINGASGGVGHFAVQIAKSFAAEVTAVCSTVNLDLVRSIGADYVVDYTREDFSSNGKKYDLILDAVGNQSLSNLKKALTAVGVAVVIGFVSWGKMLPIALQSRKESKPGRKQVSMMVTDTSASDLETMRSLVESGKVKPHIDRRYVFEELPEAMAYMETGRARGKVVVNRQ
jgi:NADPH:quinone reductase-like Zn-dependent oxidoreductase